MKATIQRSPRKENKTSMVTGTSKKRQRGPRGLAQNEDKPYIGQFKRILLLQTIDSVIINS